MRDRLREVAQETLRIVERGEYVAPSGATVVVGEAVLRARRETVLHRPADFDHLGATVASDAETRVEVTDETTAQAARRLVARERAEAVVALNFASARRPGGGFLNGARAQEEDLSRCSALYPCLLAQRAYYDANLAAGTPLYTDHMIHAPRVPFFRGDDLALLDEPFEVSILTAPAPNAREAREPAARVQETLDARAEKVLRAAAHHGHRALVLGAWGCGVFGNDPAFVADVFARWLAHPRYARAFERVVFAVFDPTEERANHRAFAARFR